MVFINVSLGNYSETIEVDLNALERQRIVSLIISVLDEIILLYLLGAALYSYLATKRGTVQKGTRSSEGTFNYTIAFNVLKVVIAACALIYTATLILLFATKKDFNCRFYHVVHAIFPSVVLAATLFAVWLRVYDLLFENPLIRSSISRRAVILSKISILYYSVVVVTNTTLFMISPPYLHTEYGCVKMQMPRDAIIRWIVFGITNTVFLIILCYLFVHPLRQHRKRVAQSGIETGNLTPLVKRLIISTCVCVTCNVAAAIVSIVYQSRFAYTSSAIQNTALVISLLAVICMLEDWHTWLIPCTRIVNRTFEKKKMHQKKRPSSSNTAEMLPMDTV